MKRLAVSFDIAGWLPLACNFTVARIAQRSLIVTVPLQTVAPPGFCNRGE